MFLNVREFFKILIFVISAYSFYIAEYKVETGRQ